MGVGASERSLSLAFSALGRGDTMGAKGAPAAEGAPADAQLVALARESPSDALEAMYSAYRVRIYTFLLRMDGDPPHADDLTQETFTKAYAAFGSLTNGHRVLPWLYRIATNAAIDQRRRRTRFGFLRLRNLADQTNEPRMTDEHGRVPEREHIQAVLRSLPPENAAALLLHALEGYSYKEIAEIQGSTLTAVRSRIARARRAFKSGYATKEPG